MLAVATLTVQGSSQAAPSARTGFGPSRVDLYAGYGYFHPFSSDIREIKYQSVLGGGVFSGAFYFTRHVGLEVEANYFPEGDQDNNCVQTAEAGPVLRVQRGRFVPFIHAVGGAAEVGGPANQRCNVLGWGVTGGGGIDYITPLLNGHLAIRPVQADFNYSRIDNGVSPANDTTRGGLGEIYAYRLSGGIVLRLGGVQQAAEVAPNLSCTPDPMELFAGQAVTVSSTVSGVRSTKDLAYTWETTGGVLAVHGDSAAIDTTGLAPGAYAIAGHLIVGAKRRVAASCTTSFTVQALQPPTVTCAADRAAINSGDRVAITAIGRSPQSRPLTYSYTTTNGVVTGSGGMASLETSGATPGAITVTCHVADDRGQAAAATASIVVATPAVTPPPPQAVLQHLCSISFERDRKRPDRVDNEAKGCLDDVALVLNRDVSSKLLMVGSHTAGESNNHAAARAMNAAQYLTQEKGVDPVRIELRIGLEPGRAVTDTLVPVGMQMDQTVGQSFDTSSVRRTGQPYGLPGRARAERPKAVVRHKRRKASASEFMKPQ